MNKINEDRCRIIFAEELEKEGEPGLAEAVRKGYDTSRGGTAAIRAMLRIAEEI